MIYMVRILRLSCMLLANDLTEHILLEGLIHTIGLRDMTEMCFFRFETLSTSSSTWECIPSIIDSITSCVIRRIAISVHAGYDDSVDLERDLWMSIPAILERPNFGHLHRLHFSVTGYVNKLAKVREWILGQLRGLEPRGILSVGPNTEE